MLGIQRWQTMDDAEEGPLAEARLLQAGLAGDRTALERLLGPHERHLYVLCRGILGHAQDAEDAVQETYLRALDALSHFRPDAPIRAWLSRIAVNVCLDWKRAHRHDPAPLGARPWEEAHFPSLSDAASPEAIVLRHLHVMDALRSLLPRHRAILLLKELDGWSVPEIAAAFGWKQDRVWNELSRARRALAEWRRREADRGEE